MNGHKIDSLNKIKVAFKTINLMGRVPGTDSIEFLRVEEPYRHGHRFGPFVRVRYALNGIEQKDCFSIDVDKGIFLHIYDDELADKLRPSALKIVEILREHTV